MEHSKMQMQGAGAIMPTFDARQVDSGQRPRRFTRRPSERDKRDLLSDGVVGSL